MSETTNISSELMRYLERDATVLGRTVNTVLDWGRDLTGAPSLKTQAAAYDAELLKQRAAQDAVLNHAATVLETSGLSTPNRHHALTLVQGMMREYPSVDVNQMRNLVNRTVNHIQDRVEGRVAQNQLNLFTAEALNHAQPFDREAGLQKLEELAIALQTVENLIDSDQDEKYISAAFNHAEDIAEWVYRDKDACLIAKTWGITPTNLGLPFLNDRGTVLHSTDLTKHIAHERGRVALETEPSREQLGLDMPPYNSSNDYAEAYADVAGDATLAHRLENENPIDILNDVRNQARRDNGIDR